ncbi:MAG TPA: PASTA domain-containing protein [Actinomycetota bacterium]|nr:PASTA domain-containing protein [Actinomycetota bacterium]
MKSTRTAHLQLTAAPTSNGHAKPRRRWSIVSALLCLFVGLIAGAGIAASNEADNRTRADGELSALRSSLAAAESSEARLSAENADLAQSVSELEAEVLNLNGQVKQLEAELNATSPLMSLVGKKLGDVKSDIEDQGWKLSVKDIPSAEPAGTVLSQSPEAGSLMQLDSKVTLSVAVPLPKPKVTPDPPSNDKPSTGSSTESTSSSPSCHASYKGACLKPDASDYDCAGGSGNGPEYTGRVQVVGSDPFGLDSDGDGWGCE